MRSNDLGKAMSTGRDKSGTSRRKEPLYERISGILRQEILDGTHPVGSQLPVEMDLCDRFSVSRHTIREALRMLRDENLVYSNKKAGTVVATDSVEKSNFLHALSVDDLVTFSQRWHYTVDSAEMVPINDTLRNWARITDRKDWLHVCGLAQQEGSPAPGCFAHYYVNPKYAAIAPQLEHNQDVPILPMIEAAFDVSVSRVEQELSAIILPDDIADRIDAKRGEPAIRVRRLCKSTENEVVLVTREIYPASRFSYRFAVNRND